MATSARKARQQIEEARNGARHGLRNRIEDKIRAMIHARRTSTIVPVDVGQREFADELVMEYRNAGWQARHHNNEIYLALPEEP